MKSLSPATHNYLPHIDGLRAIAVLGVLLAHFGIPGFEGGILGVDVFFVISGYLITALIIRESQNNTFSYKRFYLRRLRRLLPAALAVTALTLIIFIPILSENDLVKLERSALFSTLSLANIYFYSEVGYFDINASFKPLLHMWSLAVEEQFYLIWPFTIILILKKYKQRLFTITFSLLVASLVLAQLLLNYDHMFSYYMLPTRAFELLIGAALAIKSKQVNNLLLSNKYKNAATALGILLILFSYIFINKGYKLPGLYSLIPCLGAALVIAYGGLSSLSKILTYKPLTFIGKISYSLYLVHWPIFVYLTYRVPNEPNLITKLSLFPVSILLASLSYYLIENKFRHPKKTSTLSSNKSFIALNLACVIIICSPATYNLGNKLYNKINNKISTTKAATKILIVGDSHASHLSYGLDELFSNRKLDIDYKLLPGCPPLLGVYKVYGDKNQKPEQERCKDFEVQGIKEHILLNTDYDAIILAARWYWMFEPTNYGKGITFRQDYLVSNDSEKISINNSKENFVKSLKNTIDKITSKGTKVILFSQVPPLGNNISRCKSIFPWIKKKNSGRCEKLSKTDLQKRSKFTDTTILLATKGNKLAMPVIPINYFCKNDNTQCDTNNSSGESLYKDNNHLSKAGSITLINSINTEQNLLKFLQTEQ